MLSDEEKEAIEILNRFNPLDCGMEDRQAIDTILNLIEKQSEEIERINEILIWKQKHEEQLQSEIERLKDKLNKIYNEIDNKNSQLVKALNYKLFIEDKIKAKIEELEQWELYNMEIPRLSTLDERLGAKIGIKYVLQSLLEKE